MDTDSPAPHCILRSLTVLRKRLDHSRLENSQCAPVIKTSKEQGTEQREKLTSIAKRIRKAQEMNHKQEGQTNLSNSDNRGKVVKLSLVK
jgi:hypothetical protein